MKILLNTTADYFYQQPFLKSLYQALFASVYFGLLRVGELTSGEHPIKACDVQIGTNKNKILFILQTSKTHWTDTAPQMVKIVGTPINKVAKATDLTICPFQIFKNYLAKRGPAHSRTEQFFVFSDGSRVKDYHMRNTLSKILHVAKFNHTAYSTHSFRIGRSCDFLKMGISVETIKKLG